MIKIYEESRAVPDDGTAVRPDGVNVQLFARNPSDPAGMPPFVMHSLADYVPDNEYEEYEFISPRSPAAAQRIAMARFDELCKLALIGYHAEQAQSKMRIEKLRERED